MPAIVGPDGDVDFVDLPSRSPPGLGGMPFETVELDLAEGSQLVLYTDGLVEDRHQDIDTGLDQLRTVLACAGRALEVTCEAVLDALLPTRPSDDVVLLVAQLTARWGPGIPPTARSSGPNSHCPDDSRPTLASMTQP